MTGKISVKIDGVEDVRRKFDEIGVKTGRKMLRKSVAAISKPLLKELRSKAPKDDGDLKRSIKQKARAGKGDSGTLAAVDVGQIGRVRDEDRQAGYGAEFGTKHQAADPFFHPTAERHGPRIVMGLKKDLTRELLKQKVSK